MGKKKSFTIFLKEKTPFKPLKKKNEKVKINDLFPKGLTRAFGKKRPIFDGFFS